MGGRPLRAYYKYIKEQALMGLSFNKDFPLDWDTLDHEQIFIYPNSAKFGLQLSYILASAFYTGIDRLDTGPPDPEYAQLLLPRICMDHPVSVKRVVARSL